MKLVITGALGHIGSALVRNLKPGTWSEVLLLDNFLTQRYASLFALPAGIPFRFVEADILTADLAAHFKGAHAVVHLAAITNAAGSFDKADVVERVNFSGTLKVAEACCRTGSCLISLSTTSVYGTQSETVDEDCPESDLQPQSPYAESKLKAEKALAEMGASRGLRFISCRFGTIFGASPGMRFHTAVNKFIWQACMAQPTTVWRTALHQKRPYLDLQDACRAIAFILEKDLFDGRVYNVVSLNESVDGILNAIRKYIPGLAVEFVDSKIMNQLSYVVSARRFEAAGFAFRGDLDRGVRETVDLLQNCRN